MIKRYRIKVKRNFDKTVVGQQRRVDLSVGRKIRKWKYERKSQKSKCQGGRAAWLEMERIRSSGATDIVGKIRDWVKMVST